MPPQTLDHRMPMPPVPVLISLGNTTLVHEGLVLDGSIVVVKNAGVVTMLG